MLIVSNQTTILEAALYYASMGYRVFPLHSVIGGHCTCGKPPGDGHKLGKHPATPNGCKDGTTDEAIIRRWWSEKPWANIGIALDADTLGLDSDPRHGGHETVAAWEAKYGQISLTPQCRTGSGGDHWYFRLPDGVVVKNRSEVVPGIDTRSLGGYLVAPPSRHESGGVYSWITPLGTPLAMAPEWLLAIVAESPSGSPGVRSANAERSQGGIMGDSNATVFTFSTSVEPDDFVSHPGAMSPKRNDTLCRLTGVHLSRGDSLKSIEAMAVAWGLKCDPACTAEDILRRVRALARKEANKRGEGEDSGEGFGFRMIAFGDGLGRIGLEAKGGQEPIGGLTIQSNPTIRAEGENAGGIAGGLPSNPIRSADAGEGAEGPIPNPTPPILSTHSLDKNAECVPDMPKKP